MTRLSAAFAMPLPALVCFVTAGDGDTAAILDALVSGETDAIERGMPFTDPMRMQMGVNPGIPCATIF